MFLCCIPANTVMAGQENDGEPFILCSLWIVKVSRECYDDSQLRVLEDKVYSLDRREIDVAGQKWSIN